MKLVRKKTEHSAPRRGAWTGASPTHHTENSEFYRAVLVVLGRFPLTSRAAPAPDRAPSPTDSIGSASGSSGRAAPSPDEVASLLASSGSPEGFVASILSRFAGEGLSGTVAPDVYGFASLRVGGRDYPDLTQSLVPSDEDAYQVDLPSAGGWTVPGDETVRVTVFLEDRDVFADDANGTVDIDEEDLRRTWNESPGSLHWIQVDHQMTRPPTLGRAAGR